MLPKRRHGQRNVGNKLSWTMEWALNKNVRRRFLGVVCSRKVTAEESLFFLRAGFFIKGPLGLASECKLKG